MSRKAAHLAASNSLLCKFQRRSRSFGMILVPWAVVVSLCQPTPTALSKGVVHRPQKEPTTAEKLVLEGDRLRADWQERSLRQAIQKYERARLYYQAADKMLEEAHALSSIGDVLLVLGEYQKALGYHAQALELSRSIKDYAAEIKALNGLSYLCIDLGLAQKALDYRNRRRS